MMTFLNLFTSVGGAFEIDDTPGEGGIRFLAPGRRAQRRRHGDRRAPGLHDRWQQPMVVALTQARGLSIVHETVYERRLGYTAALNQMGATIQTYRECLGGTPCRFGRRNFMHSAVIAGPAKLHAGRPGDPRPAGRVQPLIAALAPRARPGSTA